MMRFISFSLAFFSLLFLSCAQNKVASLSVTLSPSDDVTGNQSIAANVFFTAFNQPPGPNGEDGKLRLRFTNPEGDTMLLTLTGEPEGVFKVSSYDFDGSNNALTATFGTGQNAEMIQISASNGFINVNEILITEGLVQTFNAEFSINLAEGGTGAGSIQLSR